MGWNLAAASPHETLEENVDLGFAGGTAQVTSSVSRWGDRDGDHPARGCGKRRSGGGEEFMGMWGGHVRARGTWTDTADLGGMEGSARKIERAGGPGRRYGGEEC